MDFYCQQTNGLPAHYAQAGDTQIAAMKHYIVVYWPDGRKNYRVQKYSGTINRIQPGKWLKSLFPDAIFPASCAFEDWFHYHYPKRG